MTFFGAAAAPGSARPSWWAFVRATSRLQLWLLAVPLWLGMTLWLRPLSLPDEGRYVGVAWEMLSSGRWLVPTLDGLPFFHKPPLFYWLSAASMTVFGPSAWAARVPSLLAATAAAYGLFAFLRRWSGKREATAALVILVTCPGWYAGAQFANHDMLVAASIAASILLIAHAVLSRETARPYRAALLGGFAAAGVGVLTKGLIGAALPFLVLTTWAFVSGRRRAVTLLFAPAGLLVFAAVVLPWFAITQIRYPAFFDYAFLHQQFERFAAGGFNNPRPWWFYLPVVLVLAFPWSGWLIARAALTRRRPVTSTLASVQSLWWVWSLVVLLFFSIPQSKLVGYALPALPPVAAVLGIAWNRVMVGPIRRGLAPVAIAAATICVVGTAAFAYFDHKSARNMAAALRSRFGPNDRVVMLDRYVYDAPFYLRSASAPIVVASWRDPAMRVGDGWQRELLDAASFASAADGARLVDVADALAMLCSSTLRTWVIADPGAPTRYEWLSRARLAHTSERLAAWEFDRNAEAAQCLQVQSRPMAPWNASAMAGRSDVRPKTGGNATGR